VLVHCELGLLRAARVAAHWRAVSSQSATV
jgi:protein-tyrosine phosphatase